jgi:chromosome partitioning protein
LFFRWKLGTGRDGQPAELVAAYRERLHVIPTNVDGFLLEQRLYQERGREYRLARVVERLAGSYDICLIDCPPSLGVLTDNALVAARRALLPVQAEDSTLRALRLLLQQIKSVEVGLRLHVEIVGMVVNGFDRRRGQVVTSTLDALQQLPLPLLGVLGDRAAVREVWRYRAPVTEHSPDSEAAAMYRELAKAIPWDGPR